jgi:hypothetical protein
MRNDINKEDADWMTMDSHPASGTRYQEVQNKGTTWARVTVEGREVVSPSYLNQHVYRQYQGRVQRAIEDMES